MNSRKAIAAGALWMALAVALGAFGAHGLKEQLLAVEGGSGLDNWHTAVRYQAWHALALVLLGVVTSRAGCTDRGALIGWAFLVGSLLFSGSIYALSLEPSATWLGPVTPLGGLLLILGWLGFAKLALSLPEESA
jgi:uncharacterized membrane protein YgdD (TMEM256/DUF423 family)